MVQLHKIALVALFAVCSSASNVEQRDYATAEQIINDIKDGLKNFGDAAAAFNGDIQPVKDAADAALAKADADITLGQNMTPLDFDDCYNLVTPLKLVQQQAYRLEKQLIPRKPEVEQYGQCDTVRGYIAQALSRSDTIIATIKSKVPTKTYRIIDQQAQILLAKVQEAADQFNSANCVNA